MNSRLLRTVIVAIGIAIGLTASYFFKTINTDINTQHSSIGVLREKAAALSATIGDVRAGQFAYVARGQGEAFWMSRVESLMPELQKQTAEFAAALASPAAQSAFEPAAAALENFRALDTRVREFVQIGSPLLAADMIFSDGLESTATATAHVTTALNAELQQREAAMASLRTRQLAVLGGGAGVVLLLMAALAFTGASAGTSAEPEALATPVVEPVRFEAPLPKARPAVTPKLLTTAQLCGELARVAEGDQLPSLLARAAKVLDATGIIVWVAEPSRQRLTPAIAYGYEGKIVARMGSIHRDANNAAAAAYRAAEVRTVAGDASTNGAVIIPLMTSDGCVGVLSAEMKGGAEKDESFQALATIFAAQLATIVATPAAAPVIVPVKVAAQG
ncbi:MAG TPA: GAF domain-containing protein [Vicinamibacterales bacterium]|nr:GAF domain-containing protein [Vicinamibacterales bacterium]